MINMLKDIKKNMGTMREEMRIQKESNRTSRDEECDQYLKEYGIYKQVRHQIKNTSKLEGIAMHPTWSEENKKIRTSGTVD